MKANSKLYIKSIPPGKKYHEIGISCEKFIIHTCIVFGHHKDQFKVISTGVQALQKAQLIFVRSYLCLNAPAVGVKKRD